MKFNFQKNQFWLAGYLIMLVFLHMNAILKNEDPISDGQTESISYDQKMEQEKDGVKVAATPRIIYYGGQGFLTKGSLAKNDKETTAAGSGKKKDSFNWSDWWEDKSADKKSAEQAPAAASQLAMPADSEQQLESAPQDSEPSSQTPEQHPTESAVSSSSDEENSTAKEDSLFPENDSNTDSISDLPSAKEKDQADSWW